MPVTPFQYMLLPFSALYRVGWAVRMWLYRSGILKRASFSVPVISVGNLSVGGTGKSPTVEYLIQQLTSENIATLSRGYGRTTSGFRLAGPNDTAATVGDEPYQFYRQYAHISVAVGEQRGLAIPQLMMERPETSVILLDDAFQHLPVQPDLSILLTSYHKPYWTDHLLPAGRLREPIAAASRADLIVVTKCPDNASTATLTAMLPPNVPTEDVWFATQQYGQLEDAFTGKPAVWPTHAVVVAAIANPSDFLQAVSSHLAGQSQPLLWPDHHRFTHRDIELICRAFGNFASDAAAVITTRKDAGRLAPYRDKFDQAGIQVCALPVHMKVLDREELLLQRIKAIIEAKKKEAIHEEDAGKAG